MSQLASLKWRNAPANWRPVIGAAFCRTHPPPAELQAKLTGAPLADLHMHPKTEIPPSAFWVRCDRRGGASVARPWGPLPTTSNRLTTSETSHPLQVFSGEPTKEDVYPNQHKTPRSPPATQRGGTVPVKPVLSSVTTRGITAPQQSETKSSAVARGPWFNTPVPQ
jgi:hypothetical protein